LADSPWSFWVAVINIAAMQAVVFLTHLRSGRISRHFARLKRECGFDAFLFFHSKGDGAALLPSRAVEAKERKIAYDYGGTDLIFIPAMLAPEGYEHIWLVEYDADFAGNWKTFFDKASESEADFLATTIFSKEDSEGWHHWPWFEAPPEVKTYYRAFCPVMRCSRTMLECYVQSLQTERWRGHYEALMPTIAAHKGLRVEDIGRGLYTNTPNDPQLSPGTFIFRPARDRYFHESPASFETGFLYHPIKPRLPLARRAFNRCVRYLQRLSLRASA
jgi:hypothetical protein